MSAVSRFLDADRIADSEFEPPRKMDRKEGNEVMDDYVSSLQVDRLISSEGGAVLIIDGPSCVGKSTLLSKLVYLRHLKMKDCVRMISQINTELFAQIEYLMSGMNAIKRARPGTILERSPLSNMAYNFAGYVYRRFEELGVGESTPPAQLISRGLSLCREFDQLFYVTEIVFDACRDIIPCPLFIVDSRFDRMLARRTQRGKRKDIATTSSAAGVRFVAAEYCAFMYIAQQIRCAVFDLGQFDEPFEVITNHLVPTLNDAMRRALIDDTHHEEHSGELGNLKVNDMQQQTMMWMGR